jgi:hypothetical protein
MQVQTDILRLQDRGDENVKLIGLVMGGFVWEFLPVPGRDQLKQGEFRVQFRENGQSVAEVIFPQPNLLQSAKTDAQITQILASAKIQRP